MDQTTGCSSNASLLLSILAECSNDATGSYQLPRLLSDSSSIQNAIALGLFSSSDEVTSSSWHPLGEHVCGRSGPLLDKHSHLLQLQSSIAEPKQLLEQFSSIKSASSFSGSHLKSTVDAKSGAYTVANLYGGGVFSSSDINHRVVDTVKNKVKGVENVGFDHPSRFMPSASQEITGQLLRHHSCPPGSIQAAATVQCGLWRQNSSPATIESHLSTDKHRISPQHTQRKRSRENYAHPYALAPDFPDRKLQAFGNPSMGCELSEVAEERIPKQTSGDPLSTNAVMCKIRAKRGCATHPRSIAERQRRSRISEKIKKLQEVVPNMDKHINIADMLEEAVEYMKHLQQKVQDLSQKCSTQR